MIKYRWRWICDICGREVENDTEYQHYAGWATTRPDWVPDIAVPEEEPWNYVSGRLVCGSHKVTIEHTMTIQE